ncbi:MAG: nuclear transport factor 2 family protein [Qipengyuania sp.]|jgi:ketosteroid isomerase-like protein|nr:nuclear transport factor 2 family protein [Qipengyuania sp.]
MNLDRLLAEREIERMIVDYAAASDAGEWGRVAAMYAEEGRMNRPTAPDVFVEGRAAILAAFEARPARVSRHIVANIQVDVAGDEASATSQILLFTAAGQPPLVGSYQDRLVRTPEGWRFVERRGSLDFAQ